MKLFVGLVLTAIGCSSDDGDGAGAANGGGGKGRIAGAAKVGTDEHEYGTDKANIVIDHEARVAIAWRNVDGVKAVHAPDAELGEPIALATERPDEVNLLLDSQGNATAAWRRAGNWSLSRSALGGAWTPLAPGALPADQTWSSDVLVAGPNGVILHTARRSDATGKSLVAARFAGGAWSAPDVLSHAPCADSQCLKDVGPRRPQAAIRQDGSELVAWPSYSWDSQTQVESCDAFMRRRVLGSGWTDTPAPGGLCHAYFATLVAGGNGDMMEFVVDHASSNLADGLAISAQSFRAGTWEAPISIGPVGASGIPLVAAMSQNGAVIVAWSAPEAGLRCAYFVAGSGWTPVDPPELRGLSPRVAIDAAGRALLVWAEWVDEPRGKIPRVFFARYSPGSGWTETRQVNADDGSNVASAPVAVAVNDAGDAALLWQESYFSRSDLWFARLP